MYGYVGLCMGMYGYVWLFMAMYGYVGLCMAVGANNFPFVFRFLTYLLSCILFLFAPVFR